jgi:hypothetical protein
MTESVRSELWRELRDEVKEKLKSEARRIEEDRYVDAVESKRESRDAKAEQFLETSASVWTDDTVIAGTRRR